MIAIGDTDCDLRDNRPMFQRVCLGTGDCKREGDLS